MTITIAEARNEYTGLAGQTVFNYTFKIYEDSDIQCFVTPVGQVADDSTDEVTISVVTGAGNPSGGTITIAAVNAGDLVTIVSNIPYNRITDYQVSGDFIAGTVNADFDRAVSLIKQVLDLQNRTLVGQKSYQNSSPFDLPAPEAAKFLKWKGDLSGLENTELVTGTYSVGTSIGDLVQLVDLGNGAGSWPSVDGSQMTGVGATRNLVDNGDFRFWQRGTSFTGVSSDPTLTADRWRWRNVNAGPGVVTISQSSDTPTEAESGHKSENSIKVDVTTVDSSIAAGDGYFLEHIIEGYDYSELEGKTGTLSFWVKCNVPGDFGVAVRNSIADRSFTHWVSYGNFPNWVKYEIPITFDYSGGTWNYENGAGLLVNFVLAAGSNFVTTGDVWASGNYLTTATQTNFMASTAIDFYISQVKLEIGPNATKFRNISYHDELLKCKRHYQRLGKGLVGAWVSASVVDLWYQFPVEFTTAPSLALVSGVTPQVEEFNVATRVGDQTTGTTIVTSTVTSAEIKFVRLDDFAGATAGNLAIGAVDSILEAYDNF